MAGVKDWSNDIVAYERDLGAIRGSGRPVAMLSSFTMSLMASFVLGADGCISGMGSVVADLQAALLAAVPDRRPRRGPADQRAAVAAGPGLLRPAIRRHAQPDEGGASAAGPDPGGSRAAPADAGLGGRAQPDSARPSRGRPRLNDPRVPRGVTDSRR